jgi:hypothetical protein
MTTLTNEDVAEFQRLAEADGQTLTTEEAERCATRLILLYRHLARPTPQELAAEARLLRAEAIVVLFTNSEAKRCVQTLKRGRGRQNV